MSLSPPLYRRDVVVVSPLMKAVAAAVQTFVRASAFPVYDMCNHVGFWRSLLLRYSARTDQLCVLLVVGNPQAKSLPKAEEAAKLLTDAIRAEIDTLLRQLQTQIVAAFPCVASFNYQMWSRGRESSVASQDSRTPAPTVPSSRCMVATNEGVTRRRAVHRGETLRPHLPRVAVRLLPGQHTRRGGALQEHRRLAVAAGQHAAAGRLLRHRNHRTLLGQPRETCRDKGEVRGRSSALTSRPRLSRTPSGTRWQTESRTASSFARLRRR